ncbi:GlxA family transcriptional regulator [Pseudoduganella armeniaca]|uniref:AraC family transcriptional regulator n=1 Tax=Pseudoduganella armeniaca TaxID=2072590 RepID=A0A2R4C9R0_9BURK|nr:helix-turn-helix domain-containing protein [Pseudoduganella armeniaca]AVR96341.1 AraC family transcriptional regulator [Pseudoduganella armeniaca]
MHQPPHRIVILGLPPAQMLDVTGALDVFTIASDIVEAGGGPRPYTVMLAGPEAGPLMTTSGIALHATHGMTDAALRADTLLVAGGRGARAWAGNAELVAALAALCARAERVGSICTGAFALAATGLLDGQRVTTHWAHFDELAARFPALAIDRDALFVSAGKYHTSAGITAGIDFTLALVERDLGTALARAVARELVVFMKRPGGQAQFSTRLLHDASGTAAERFATLTHWIAEHLADDLCVDVLAARLSMSPRNFVRRFTAAMGTTPGKYVLMLRLDEARRLLSEGDLPVAQVARRCGFQSDEAMRGAFQRHVSTSPTAFRARFRSAAPGARLAEKLG